MAIRGQAQVNSLFKVDAFIFLTSKAVETNDEDMLIDHDLEMFEMGNPWKVVMHMVLN